MTDREQIGTLLDEASKLTNHKEFVIIGSLSVLGALAKPPPSMVLSVDIDLYPRLDPGRAGEIQAALGHGTAFDEKHGFFADAVTPNLAALPEGWEGRFKRLEYPNGITAYYLDPDDAAVSKLARSEPRDRRWVREGIKAGILNADTIERRMSDAVSRYKPNTIAQRKSWPKNVAGPSTNSSAPIARTTALAVDLANFTAGARRRTSSISLRTTAR